MEAVARKSISEQITSALRREILSGVLAAGARLPPEAELALRFGTNRNTLREAVRSLEGLNLIHVRQGDGVTVRDFRRVGELSLLPYYLAEAATPREQQTALDELLQLRRFVLAEAAAHAARRATADEVTELRRCLAAITAASERPDARAELIAADLELYRKLVTAAHSLITVWLFNTFERVYSSVITLLENLWVVPANYLAQLTAIVEAVAARDGDAAQRLMAAHLASGDDLALGRLR